MKERRNFILEYLEEKKILDSFSIQIRSKFKGLLFKRNFINSTRNEVGQSTVEFALTLMLLLAFVFFFFQLTMVSAFGNFAHYATFMAARAYLSAGADRQDQRERAKDVIIKLLKKSAGQAGIDRFPSIAKGFRGSEIGGLDLDPPGQFNPTDRNFSWLEGVRYTFRSKLFLIPLAGLGRSEGGPAANFLTLTSESWLGREPSFEECKVDLEKTSGLVFFDNGC